MNPSSSSLTNLPSFRVASKNQKRVQRRDMITPVSLGWVNLKTLFSEKNPTLFPLSNKMSLLCLPDKETHTSRSTPFKSFREMTEADKYTKSNSRKFPVNSISGIKGRLKLNVTTRRNYLKKINTEQNKVVKDIVGQINLWNRRANSMPKIKIVNTRNILAEEEERMFKRKLTTTDTKVTINDDPVSLKSRIAKIKTLDLSWENINPDLPLTTREGCTFTAVGNKAWLIGGISDRVIDEIWSLDLFSGEFRLEDKISSQSKFSRFNHTAVCTSRKILIFGGEKTSNQFIYSRSCTNEVIIIDVCRIICNLR